jgi:hypothetical protein
VEEICLLARLSNELAAAVVGTQSDFHIYVFQDRFGSEPTVQGSLALFAGEAVEGGNAARRPGGKAELISLLKSPTISEALSELQADPAAWIQNFVSAQAHHTNLPLDVPDGFSQVINLSMREPSTIIDRDNIPVKRGS